MNDKRSLVEVGAMCHALQLDNSGGDRRTESLQAGRQARGARDDGRVRLGWSLVSNFGRTRALFLVHHEHEDCGDDKHAHQAGHHDPCDCRRAQA